MQTKIDYGIDAPNVIRNLILIGIFCLILAEVSLNFPDNFFYQFHLFLFITSAICLLEGFFMIFYVKTGKFRHRDRILNMIQWKGDEQVLDIGTGRGLMLIGAAKKLINGKATGIDIWNQADLNNNSLENALQNANLEQVSEKIQIINMDVRIMSFPDNYFDIILSNLCLHNIYSRVERAKACKEIIRVLKPGGTAIISDFRHLPEYNSIFAKAGFKTKISPPYILDTFPPLRILTAFK